MEISTNLVVTSIRTYWTRALRELPPESRGERTLRADDRYCALGVFADLCVRDMRAFVWEDATDIIQPENLYGEVGYALRRIDGGLDIRGLSRELRVLLMMTSAQEGTIGTMNDRGKSFEEIARHIEWTLPGCAENPLPPSLTWGFARILLPTRIADPGILVPPLPPTFDPLEIKR